MNVKRIIAWVAALWVFLPGAALRADEAVRKALDVIPGEAVGFVSVLNLAQLDVDFQQAVNALGLTPFMPPGTSPVGVIQQYLQMTEGLDTNGPICVVIMPALNPFEFTQKIALVVPATDPAKLLGAMKITAGEGGVWTGTLHGAPAFAMTTNKGVILGPTADLVKAVSTSQGDITEKMSEGDLDAFDGADVVLWLDVERVASLLKPQIDSMLGMMMMMQGGANPAQMEANKKQIDEFIQGTKSFAMAISLKTTGLGLRFGICAKPGSEMAGKMKTITTEGSLLEGVPAGPYMVAFGQTIDPEHTKRNLDDMDAMFTVGDDVPQLNKEPWGKFKEQVKEGVVLLAGFGGSVEVLPPGPNGVFGASLVVDTTDSAKLLEVVAVAVASIKEFVSGGEAKPILDAMSYTTDAESQSGVKVHHLRIDLSKLEDVDEDDREEVMAVLGQDGPLVRIAAADSKTVVMTFGGGSAYLGRLIAQAQSKTAPLESDPGIVKVAPELPVKRTFELYVAVDKVLEGVKAAMKAVGEEEELPVALPELNAPLAVVTSGGQGWAQVELFFPTELMIAAKNAGMALMMPSGPVEETPAGGTVSP